MPLLVSVLGAILMPSPEHGEFQRVIAVDEFNLIQEDERAEQALVRVARLARQDLLEVSDALFGLSGLCLVFRQRNPRMFEHLRERVGALRGYSFEDVAQLGPGEALLAASDTTDPRWRAATRRVRLRPLRCMHGGMTRAMI